MRWQTFVLAFALGGASIRPCLAIDYLVFVVDRSRSIDEGELLLQREAYVRLLSDPTMAQALGGAQVAIVEFDTRPEVMVDWSDAPTAAAIYSRSSSNGLRGQTAIGRALASAIRLLSGKQGRLVIDVSGDGKENVAPALLTRARDAAARRLIEINGLAIENGNTPGIERYYRQRVVNGFAIAVTDTDDFFQALRRKFLLEVAGRRLLPPDQADRELAQAEAAPHGR